MPVWYLLLVAALQGLTEFLPVSSSGHLILLPRLSDMPDQGAAIDVAVHVGTLAAVVVYFWPDVRLALSGIPRLLRGRIDSQGAWLALLLGVATVPVVIAGAIVALAGWQEALRSTLVVGWATILFGLLLWWADRTGAQDRPASRWSLRHAMVMGLWQAVALIPGTSRSGIVITAARRLGYARPDAARLAMLMSIPTIAASGALTGAGVALAGDAGALRDWGLAVGFAFLTGLAGLWVLMRLARTVSFTPYVIYRLGLGGLLLWIGYSA
jgi:undecaprenyl-diphosphatase